MLQAVCSSHPQTKLKAQWVGVVWAELKATSKFLVPPIPSYIILIIEGFHS